YVHGKKGPQEPEPSPSDDRTSEYSTCQSNDSAESTETTSEHSSSLEPETLSVSQKVSVSEPEGVSTPKPKTVDPSCDSHVKPPRQPVREQETPKGNRKT
ncbi:hypothetical protein Tco_0515668, partial [Tanacetum coccineum]